MAKFKPGDVILRELKDGKIIFLILKKNDKDLKCGYGNGYYKCFCFHHFHSDWNTKQNFIDSYVIDNFYEKVA